METTFAARTMSPANKTRITGFSASLIMLIFFVLADFFQHELIFWSLAWLSFVFSGACHMLANYLSRKSGDTGEIGKTIHYMNNKMIMLMIYSIFIPLKIVHWTFVLVIMFPEFTMIMIKLLGLIRGETFQKKGNHKLWRRIKRLSQIVAANFFFLALFNYSEFVHLNALREYIIPYRDNLLWQQIHIALQVVIATVSIATMIISVLPYKQYLMKALQNMYYDKFGNRVYDENSPEIAKRIISPANWVTLSALFISFIMVGCFVAAEIVETNQYKRFLLGFIFFAISMILDGIDGMLARKFKTCGDMGGTLDQIRDKKTMLMIFLPLMAFGSIGVIFFIVIFLREFMVSMFRIIYLHESNKPGAPKLGVSAKIWGKAKTLSQSFFAVFLGCNLFFYSNTMYWPWFKETLNLSYYVESTGLQITWITIQLLIAIISFISGIMYAIDYKYYLYNAFLDVKEKEKTAQECAI